MRRRRKRKRKKRRRSEARDGSLRRCMRFRETFFFVSTQTDEKSRSNVVGSELSSASVSRRRAGSRSDASPRPHRAAELGEARRQRARRGRRRDRVDVASVHQHGRRVHLDGPDPENRPEARPGPPGASRGASRTPRSREGGWYRPECPGPRILIYVYIYIYRYILHLMSICLCIIYYVYETISTLPLYYISYIIYCVLHYI